MGYPVKKADHKFSYAEYMTWPDEERWELIDGVAYDMSPAPNRRHQGILRDLGFIIHGYLKDKPCEVNLAPFDVRFPDADTEEVSDDAIFTVVQPDIAVFCDPSRLDDRGGIGAPDIAVEILSPGTALKDKREKLTLYERHGVKEYWIVDPNDDTVMVFSFKAGGDGYGTPKVYSSEDVLTTPILEGLEIALAEVFHQY